MMPAPSRINKYVNRINYEYDENGRTLIDLEIRVENC